MAGYRDRADDTAQPYGADDRTVTGWLNEAVDEAAIRAKLLFDSSSPICSLPIRANQAVYQLASAIDTVSDAWLESTGAQLVGTDQSAMDRLQPPPGWVVSPDNWPTINWRKWTGRPRWFIQDDRRLQLVPVPTAADTLHLSVYRIAMSSERLRAENKSGEPVIAGKWHERLIDWALYRAYSRRDEDQSDPNLAATHFGLFEASFGSRPSANVARKRNERRAHTTRINWPR